LDRRLGIRMALERTIHARVELDDVRWRAPHDGGREILRDHRVDGARAFAEITPELAAPVLEDRRLPPAGAALGIAHLEDGVAADRLLQPRPFVLASCRQADVKKLDAGDGRLAHVAPRTMMSSSVSVTSESSSQPRSVTSTMSLFCMPKPNP